MVGTPIGNLEDITLRALRVLGEVDVIAAEDTRKTRILLERYGIETPLVPFHEHTRAAALERLLQRLRSEDVALVSDAGTPGISDPGYRLVRAALAAGLPVVSVPGPSAVIAALVVSGLPTHAFLFVGFLPRKSGQRRRLFVAQREREETLVAFESPTRLLSSLRDLAEVLPDRPTVVARELTKQFETLVRGTACEVLERFLAEPPRGEITVLVGGRPAERGARAH